MEEMSAEMKQIREAYHQASTIAGDIAYRIDCFKVELQNKFNEMVELNKKAQSLNQPKTDPQELTVVAPTEGN